MEATFERLSACSMTFCSSEMYCEVDSRRRASHAFVDNILEELREGVRALLEALMEMDP
jgi:hypothetical protein